MTHVKMIRKNETKNGFNPMTSDEFLKDEPLGWVACKGGDIAIFAGVKTPMVFPSKEAAEDAGYTLNEGYRPVHSYKGHSAIFRNGLRREGSEKEVTFSANSFEDLFRAILRWYKVDSDEIEIEVEDFASDRPGKIIDATAVMKWLDAAGQDQGRVIAALKGPGLSWKIPEDTGA